MSTKRKLGMVAAVTLLGGLTLIPAANASAAQVTEYTIQTVTEGGGVAPVLFKDWAANTKLLYSDGSQVSKNSWIASGTHLRFQVNPTAPNGIWIDTDKAFLKFWPSSDDQTRCLSAASGSYCLYADSTHDMQIVTSTSRVLEWTVETYMAYGGSVLWAPVTDWSANAVLVRQDGQPVQRGAAFGPHDPLRFIVTNQDASNGIWLKWFYGEGVLMKFWPSDDAKTGCPVSSNCHYVQGTHHVYMPYFNGGN